MTSPAAANHLAVHPHSQTAKFFKLVNDGAPHCLRYRQWLEAWQEDGAYVIYQMETRPDGLGIRETQLNSCGSNLLVGVHFMRFERRMIEEGYVRENMTESSSGNSRGGIGLTPRRSPALQLRRAMGLIPHAVS